MKLLQQSRHQFYEPMNPSHIQSAYAHQLKNLGLNSEDKCWWVESDYAIDFKKA